MSGRRDLTRGGGGGVSVLTVGGSLASCLRWLFASRRATAVLWMHLTESELLFHTVPFPFRGGDWQCDACLDIFCLPRGKICVRLCVFVCNRPLSDTVSHCVSIFSPSPQTLNVCPIVLLFLSGLLKYELNVFLQGNSHWMHFWFMTKVLASNCNLRGWFCRWFIAYIQYVLIQMHL